MSQISISKIQEKSRNKPWRVTYQNPVTRRRATRHFKNKPDARKFAVEMGYEAAEPDFHVSPAERVWLARQRQLAAKAGLTMEAALKRLEEGNGFLHFKAVSVEDLIEKFLEDKRAKGRRAKTLEHYSRILGFFSQSFKNANVQEIQTVDVLTWVQRRYQHPESQATSLTPILGMFRWAASPHRKYVDASWLQRVSKTDKAMEDRKLPMVFNPEELTTILKAVARSIVPALALGAFAGIRPEELISESKAKQVLHWDSVNFDLKEITIPAKVSKTRQEATLRQVPNNLWQWLALTPRKDRVGPVCRCNYRNYRKARRSALQATTHYKNWPKDVLRHSFATYNYQVRGLEHTLSCMRHIGGSKMLWRHYLGDAWKKRAEAYFSISPN